MNLQDAAVKVSVIVPVYNVEKYVEECLSSIIHQTLKEIEIIIVNDGGTDSSFDICKRFADQDKRIVLISQENKGLGEARNVGMSFAHGEYLSFIDSDDYIEEKFLELLYKQATAAGADVAVGEINRYYEVSGKYEYHCHFEQPKKICIDDNNYEEFLTKYYFSNIYAPYACDKIYKKNYIEKINAKFGDNKRIFAEDVWFQLQILRFNPSILFCHGSKYIYRQRSTSIMNSPKPNVLKRQVTAVKDYLSMIQRERKHKEEENIADLLAEEALTQAVLNQVKFGDSKKEFFNDVSIVLKDATMVERLKNLHSKKSYRFIENKGRKNFVRIIGFLFFIRCYKMAEMLYWITYKLIYSTFRREK